MGHPAGCFNAPAPEDGGEQSGTESFSKAADHIMQPGRYLSGKIQTAVKPFEFADVSV
jgi:hypothetical protein